MLASSRHLVGVSLVAALAACGPSGVAFDPIDPRDGGASLDGGGGFDGGVTADSGATADGGAAADGGATPDSGDESDGGNTPDAGDGTDGGNTPDAGDAVAPWIVRTRPDGGETGVSATTDLEVEFSESMDPLSVTFSGTPPVALGSPDWRAEDTIVRLTPVSPLEYLQVYGFTVQGTDVAGNVLPADSGFGFVTGPAPDVTPPRVQTTEPSNGALGVVPEATLRIVFSEAMDQGSVRWSLVPPLALGVAVWTADGQEVTVAPLVPLAPSTTYVVEVGGTDLAGNALAGPPDSTFSFTTRAPPDVAPPRLVGTTPAPDDGAVAPETKLVLTFDEPIDPASLQVVAVPAADQGVPVWSDGGRTATFAAPVERWAELTDYAVTILAADLSGNSASFQRSFRTAADVTPPVLVRTSPADGAVGVAVDAGVSLVFDEPMDHASVEGAFSIAGSTSIDGGVFEWSGQVMTYRPPRHFDWGEEVLFSLSAGSADVAGNPMPGSTSRTFRARRRSTVTVYATGETVVPGTVFADGYLTSSASCSGLATVYAGNQKAMVGSAASSGQHHRGYLTFSIAALDALENVVVGGATLSAYQSTCRGSPFASSYGMRIEAWHVSHGSMVSTGSCFTPNLGARTYSLSASATPGLKIASVTAAVQSDWENRSLRGSCRPRRPARTPATTRPSTPSPPRGPRCKSPSSTTERRASRARHVLTPPAMGTRGSFVATHAPVPPKGYASSRRRSRSSTATMARSAAAAAVRLTLVRQSRGGLKRTARMLATPARSSR
jgi:hypothetical protein